MRLLQTNVEGIPALVPGQRQTCETCALTKSAKTINRDAQTYENRYSESIQISGGHWRPTPSGEVYTHVHGRLYATVVDLPDQNSYGAIREVPRVADDG